MSQGVVVLVGNWQRDSCPMGTIVLQGSCPRGSCPQGSCPRGSCPKGSCPRGSCPQGCFPRGSCPRTEFDMRHGQRYATMGFLKFDKQQGT